MRSGVLHSSISIHVLREEDDMLFAIAHLHSWLFLSTSSARRTTTQTCIITAPEQTISIHVLREEDDGGSLRH